MSSQVVDAYLIPEDATLADAMRQLEETARRCIFVIKGDRELVGSLTDGDVRRLILRSGSLNGTAGEAANRNPVVVQKGTRPNASLFEARNNIPAIPVVDEHGRVCDIFFADGMNEERECAVLDEPMPVVMMAGGKGTRLLPLTAIIPKPLIPIGGITIAERIMNRFHEGGCNDFWLVVNYKREMIRAYFDEAQKEYSVRCVDEDEFRGTGGGIKLLENDIDSTFILTNCDILVDVSLPDLVSSHRESGNLVTAICSLQSYTIPYGTIEIGSGGEIASMREKPTITSLVNTGVYVVEPEVFSYIGEDESIGFPDVMLRCQEAGGRVGVFPVGESAWLDMGQLDELRHMREVLGGGLS